MEKFLSEFLDSRDKKFKDGLISFSELILLV